MKINLKGKKVFITGSGGLLGRTFIREILNCGGEVVATELPGKRSEFLRDEFNYSEKFSFYELDVTDELQIESLFHIFKSENHAPDIFINNAAITGELLVGEGNRFPDLSSTTLQDWNKALSVNLTGAFLIARQIDRDLIHSNKIKLINISSMYAFKAPHHDIYQDIPFKSFSAYSASKAGLHGLTLWLSSYWSQYDASVNTLAPGAVFNNHSDLFESRIKKLIISNRMARPTEIADVVLFLCSDFSSYITGQAINVDGGFSAW